MAEPEPELVYLSKFWPTPIGSPYVTVELNVRSGDTLEDFDFTAKVELRDGTWRGTGGGLKAKNLADAKHQAMFKLVTLLGEVLADTLERIPKP